MNTQSEKKPENHVTHRAQVGVECPFCHWRYFQEIQLEDPLAESPLEKEIRGHLESWLGSKCPDHLGAIAQLSKN